MIGVFAVLAATAAAPTVDGPPLEWLNEHSPFGVDVTPDGKVWLNMDGHGFSADYSVLANDLKNSNGRFRKVWIRGNYAHDARVKFREQKMRVTVDCEGEYMTTEYLITYDAEGRVLGANSQSITDLIIPGSNADSWKAFICAG